MQAPPELPGFGPEVSNRLSDLNASSLLYGGILLEGCGRSGHSLEMQIIKSASAYQAAQLA